MGPPQKRAYGCLGCWRSFYIFLDTTVVNSLSIAHIDLQELHLSWYCFLLRLRNGQRRALLHWHTSLRLGNYSLRLLSCQTRDCGCGNPLVPFGQRQAHIYRQLCWATASWRRSYRPSAFDLAKAHSICWRPSASRQLASSHKWSASCLRKLACHIWCKPWKKLEKPGNSETWSEARTEKTKHQNRIREKEAWKDQIPGKVALELYLQPMQEPLLLLARYGPNQIQPAQKHRPEAPLFLLHLPQVHLVTTELQMQNDYHKEGCCPDTPRKKV